MAFKRGFKVFEARVCHFIITILKETLKFRFIELKIVQMRVIVFGEIGYGVDDYITILIQSTFQPALANFIVRVENVLFEKVHLDVFGLAARYEAFFDRARLRFVVLVFDVLNERFDVLESEIAMIKITLVWVHGENF
jgi:hypothetical protein